MSETRKWTDERLDDLDQRLDRVDATIRELRRDVRDDIRDQRREATKQHDDQSGELREVRDELMIEINNVNARIETFGDSFNDVVKHIFERDGARQIEMRKALLSFAGPIIAALVAGVVTVLVVILFGAPHP